MLFEFRIPGVVDARQYTVPVEAAMDAVQCSANLSQNFLLREKHTRETPRCSWSKALIGLECKSRSLKCLTTLQITTLR